MLVHMAHELLAARAARIRTIRHRVVAGTVAAFALAWGIVAFDGSMGAETTTTAQTTTPSTTSTDTTSSDDSSTLSTSQS
jgi:hypothetical protein